MKKFFLFAFVFSFMLVFSFVVSAHLDAGKDITKDGYIIDFGYSPAKIPKNTQAEITVNLVNQTTLKPVNVTSVLTRIILKNRIVFAGEFKPKDGNIAFTYTFPQDGNHTIELQFKNQTGVIESQNFYIDVEEKPTIDFYIIFLIAIIVILAAIRNGNQKRKSSNS